VLEPRHTRVTRHRCTKESPFVPGAHPYANHPDAVVATPDAKIGAIYLKCPHCGQKFQVVAVDPSRR
jgi:transcription elongation factor Elf1